MFDQFRQPDRFAGLVLAHEDHTLRHFTFRERHRFKSRNTLATARQFYGTLKRANLAGLDAKHVQFRLGIARIVDAAGNGMESFALRCQLLTLMQIARRLGDDAEQLEIILRKHDGVVASALFLAVEATWAQRKSETAILFGTFLQIADQQENMIDAFDRMRHTKLPFLFLGRSQNDLVDRNLGIHIGNIERGVSHILGLDDIIHAGEIEARTTRQKRRRHLTGTQHCRPDAVRPFLRIQAGAQIVERMFGPHHRGRRRRAMKTALPGRCVDHQPTTLRAHGRQSSGNHIDCTLDVDVDDIVP